MKGESVDIAQDKLSKLKKLFPEIFSEGKVDPEKLRLSIGEDLNIQNERYVLNWSGKSDAFRVLQTPTTATLAPAYADASAGRPTSEGIGDINKTGNVFIEGENLEVLKILQKSYYGKIKMIYIDPPYNTGNDNFIYPDRFSESKEEYLKRIGEKDEEGYLLKEGLFRKNSKESGQYHSNWLTMMYPRLFLARNLLHDDGVIFVSIDDNEVHNLILLMNEVFGEENFIGNVIWNSTKSVTNTALISVSHTHTLVYAKMKDYFVEHRYNFRLPEQGEGFSNPDNDPRGPWKADPFQVGGERPNQLYPIVNPKTGKTYKPNSGCSWKNDYEHFQKLLADNRIVFGVSGEAGPQRKRFKFEAEERGRVAKTIWDDVDTTTNATTQLNELFGHKVFDNPKPIDLVKRIMELGIYDPSEAIVLDFFAGSGSTAHAVLDLNKEDGGNRRFILVQLPEKTKEDSEAFKAGYKTIAEIGKERIRRVIKKMVKDKKDNPSLFKDKAEMDLGFKVFKLKQSNFKIWRSDVIEDGKDLEKQMDVFEKNVKPEAKINNMVWEILLKSGYDLNTKVEILDSRFRGNDKEKGNDKEMLKQVQHDKSAFKDCPVYSASEGEIIIALSKISQPAIKEIIKLKPKRCICLDSLFAGNDQLKTNTVLQMRDSGIEFKTI